MSQRLAIGQDRSGYDAFITEDMSPEEIEKILDWDWVRSSSGSYLGPWKIFIYDTDLFNKVDPALQAFFAQRGQAYPECIWYFYSEDDEKISHPSREELDEWLKLLEKESNNG